MIYSIRHLPEVIRIGVQTESGVEAIGFDLRPWLDMYDGIDVTIWPTRPGESAAYRVADKNMELVGTVLYWYPDLSDTSIAGCGTVELLGITGDKRKLSGVCETEILPTSLGETQETPEAARPWVDEVVGAAEEAKKQADRAEEIANGFVVAGIAGAVRYDKAQSLTEEQKALARQNIGAGTGDANGAAIEIDTTLTKAGAAADAKVVGDELDALNEEIAKLPSGGGTQADWAMNDAADPAYVKNRTHWVERPYEPIVVTPDMVGAEGVDTVDISALLGYPAGTAILYKVSDHVLTIDDTGTSKVYNTLADGKVVNGPITVQSFDMIPGIFEVSCTVYLDGNYYNEKRVYSINIAGDFTAEMGIVIPSTGLYMDSYDSGIASFEINADTYHTIDKRYLPDAFASEEYVDNAISKAITGAIGGSY